MLTTSRSRWLAAGLCLLVAGGLLWAASARTERTTESSFAEQMQATMTRMAADSGNMRMSGDADEDFAAMMIVHHQGAIDMAKAELLHGKNPVLRRVAQEIVVTQAAEIEVLRRELPADSALCRPTR